MMSMNVPAQKYAAFPCTLGTIGATYRYITEEWQPRSGYEHADAPDFEYYDEEPDPNAPPQEMKLWIYWPISRNTITINSEAPCVSPFTGPPKR